MVGGGEEPAVVNFSFFFYFILLGVSVRKAYEILHCSILFCLRRAYVSFVLRVPIYSYIIKRCRKEIQEVSLIGGFFLKGFCVYLNILYVLEGENIGRLPIIYSCSGVIFQLYVFTRI